MTAGVASQSSEDTMSPAAHAAKGDRLRVLVVMPLAEPRGGAEAALIQLLAHGQDRAQWSVVFLTDGPMVKTVEDMGIEVHVIPSGRVRQLGSAWRCITRLKRLMTAGGFDGVLGWMSKAHLYGGTAAWLAGRPAVWFQHGNPSPRCRLEKLIASIPARGILTCSDSVAGLQGAIRPVRPMRVAYAPVDLERFDPSALPPALEARRQLGLPEQGPIIGMAARLQRWKGVHVLVEAMPEILRRHPDATAVIVGGEHPLEADYPGWLREQIRRLGLERQIRLEGLRHNVPMWMTAMDVVVHASDNEPLGMVVIEAMALGKPVVAGRSGGPAEVITDGVDGLLTPFGDAAQLAEAVCRIVGDRGLAVALGEAARRRAADFSGEHYARRVIDSLTVMLQTADIPAQGRVCA